MVALRLPCAQLRPLNMAVNALFFSDGSQKTLAAFVVWLALLEVMRTNEHTQEEWQHPCVVSLVGSLLRLRTVFRSSTAADETDAAVARIVKQNVDSKVQPVSAISWAAILMTMSEGSYEQCIARYNSHPEVQAFEKEHGCGGISLDGRKRQARL